MTWSYGLEPETSNRDAVRFRIGDTNANDQQLQDEEIDYLLSANVANGNVEEAAVKACKGLAAKYARQVNKSVGDLSIAAGDRATHYNDLAKQIAQEAGLDVPVAAPYAGGVRISDEQVLDEDVDAELGADFRIGQTDFDQSRQSRRRDDRDYGSV